MITTVTSLGRSGLSDWLIQRTSAFVMTAYLFFIVGYLIANPDLSYAQWAALNASLPMRMFSLLTMLSIAAHAWIGMWCVLTDYITERLIGPKATAIQALRRPASKLSSPTPKSIIICRIPATAW